MFTKNSRKGFTVVELVIVIAIIAILAVALIPTFGGLIDSANATGDIALAREMNIALMLSPNVDNPNKAMEVLQEAGYLVGNFNPRADKNYFAWDSTTNQILYISKDDPTKPLFAADPNYGTPDKWWIAVSGIDKMTDGFSNWIFTENVEAKSASDVLSFDAPVGLSVVSGKVFDYPVSITTEAAGSIMLDGNFTEKVSITAPNADFAQYGLTTDLEINAIANASAHIHGFVETMTYKAGRIVVEPTGYIANWNDKTTDTESTVEIKGIISNLTQVGTATYNKAGGTIVGKSEGVTLPSSLTESDLGHNGEYTWKIATVEDLLKFREAVNSGYDYKGVTVSLVADLDISHLNWNIPIGTSVTYEPDDNTLSFANANPFAGIFEGNNHTIKGLTMIDVPKGGYGGGLFGYCSNARIQNLNLVDVVIDSEATASPVAGMLFFWSDVINVNVSGTAKGNWCAGIASYAQYGVKIEDCTVDMDFTASNYGKYNNIRVGGVVGQYNNDYEGRNLQILNTDVSKCTMTLVNDGKESTVFAGGLVAQHTGGTITADYKNAEGTVPVQGMSAGQYGDIDPTLLGIPVTTDTGLTIGKQKLTAFPAG